jgi:GNAT superfamily N-acetyltransferase
MAEPTIRKATLTDAPQIAQLNGELGYPVEAGEMKSRLERLLTRTDHAAFVAEMAPDGVIGWIEGEERDILAVGRVGEIVGLVVGAQHRGAGVARRLVEAVEQWAVGRGLGLVSLRSNVVRPESHAFYEKVGYARFKTQHAYRKWLRDSGEKS